MQSLSLTWLRLCRSPSLPKKLDRKHTNWKHFASFRRHVLKEYCEVAIELSMALKGFARAARPWQHPSHPLPAPKPFQYPQMLEILLLRFHQKSKLLVGGHGFVCASPSCVCGRAEGCCLACEGFGINLAARARCSRASPFSHGVKKTDF